MKHINTRYPYSARRSRRYPYPNEADPSYFAGRILEGLAAIAVSMGTVTLFLFMVIL